MQPQSTPRSLSPHTTGPALRNWYLSLANHDPRDTKGHLEGIAICLLLIGLYVQDGPESALTDNGLHAKVGIWKGVIQDLLGVREAEK
jgi:hypothetical protein